MQKVFEKGIYGILIEVMNGKFAENAKDSESY